MTVYTANTPIHMLMPPYILISLSATLLNTVFTPLHVFPGPQPSVLDDVDGWTDVKIRQVDGWMDR